MDIAGDIASDIDCRRINDKHVLHKRAHPARKTVDAVWPPELLVKLPCPLPCYRIRFVDGGDVPFHRLNLIFALFNGKAEEIVVISKIAELFKRDLGIRTRHCLDIASDIEIHPYRRRPFFQSGFLRFAGT